MAAGHLPACQPARPTLQLGSRPQGVGPPSLLMACACAHDLVQRWPAGGTWTRARMLAAPHQALEPLNPGAPEPWGRAGPRAGFWAVVPFQFSVLLGLDITYMVTAGQSLQVRGQRTLHAPANAGRPCCPREQRPHAL